MFEAQKQQQQSDGHGKRGAPMSWRYRHSGLLQMTPLRKALQYFVVPKHAFTCLPATSASCPQCNQQPCLCCGHHIAQVQWEQNNLPPHTAPLTDSMHLLASSGRLKVMYALPVGPFRLTEDPYGPILFTDICFTIFPKAPKYSGPMRVSS